jgi:hypothetical protein
VGSSPSTVTATPDVRAAFAEASATTAQDKALDFGLARILDGLAVLITQRRRDAPARTDTKPRTQ